jgi:hypothetical protein
MWQPVIEGEVWAVEVSERVTKVDGAEKKYPVCFMDLLIRKPEKGQQKVRLYCADMAAALGCKVHEGKSVSIPLIKYSQEGNGVVLAVGRVEDVKLLVK